MENILTRMHKTDMKSSCSCFCRLTQMCSWWARKKYMIYLIHSWHSSNASLCVFNFISIFIIFSGYISHRIFFFGSCSENLIILSINMTWRRIQYLEQSVFDRHTLSIVAIHDWHRHKPKITFRRRQWCIEWYSFQKRFLFSLPSSVSMFWCPTQTMVFEQEKPPIICIVVKQQPKSVLYSTFYFAFSLCVYAAPCSASTFCLHTIFIYHGRSIFFLPQPPSPYSSQQPFPISIASLPRALFRQSFPLIDQ